MVNKALRLLLAVVASNTTELQKIDKALPMLRSSVTKRENAIKLVEEALPPIAALSVMCDALRMM